MTRPAANAGARAAQRVAPDVAAQGVDAGEAISGERADWRIRRFGELSPIELARIYRARQLVFAIEQQCIYLDADKCDETAWHIAAWSPLQALPLAYARLINPGGKYAEPSMGRVITTAAARGVGLGRELVRRVLDHSAAVYPGQGIRISAQQQLERFYAGFGFATVGEAYLEDGIPHLEMLRPG